MKLSIIVARDRNGIIGVDNGLPWRLPEDLKHFKATTMGKPMIMGRKTFDSIGRPLPGRTTLVVTRQVDWSFEGVVTCTSLEQAIERAVDFLNEEQQEIIVAGGEEIYRQSLPRVGRIYLTEVDTEVVGDARFPYLDEAEWNKSVTAEGFSEKAGLAYRFVTCDRDVTQ